MKLALVVLLALGSAARASEVRLSELLYDAAGSDDGAVFVELYGPPGAPLAGFVLVGVNGSGGGATHVVDLSPWSIPARGFFVLADARGDGSTRIAGADAAVADLDFQNGPDSVTLSFGSVVVDALGYGEFGPGDVFAGEGRAAPDVPAGFSLARRFADVDTGDNLSDFVASARPTPGAGDLKGIGVAAPETGAVGLFGAGLVLLAAAGRRYSRKAKTCPASVTANTRPPNRSGGDRDLLPRL